LRNSTNFSAAYIALQQGFSLPDARLSDI